MAKVRIGHFVEAQILEAIEIDYIDESEVLSPADDRFHVDKKEFQVPFCSSVSLFFLLKSWTSFFESFITAVTSQLWDLTFSVFLTAQP